MTNLVAVGDNCLDVYLTKDAMTVGGNALNVARIGATRAARRATSGRWDGTSKPR